MAKESRSTQYELIGERVRIFQRGDRWYANFQHGGHQVRQSLKTTSKKEARRQALLIEARLMTNEFAVQSKAPTLEQIISQYREYLLTVGRAAKTMAKYEYAFGLFLDLAARRKVRSILGVNQTFVDAFRAERKKCVVAGRKDRDTQAQKAGKKTVHNDVVLLKQLINFALRRKLIATDPLAGMQLARPKTRPQPFWTREQMDQIIAAANAHHRPAFVILAETGMRIGELKYLTWTGIDFANGVIHIQEKVIHTPEGEVVWRPKTGDARVIPMSPTAHNVLARLPRKSTWILTARPSSKYPAGDHQISERRLLQHLKSVLAKLHLPGHLHTFRHSFISHALTSGVPEALVRRWVGHVDADILKMYTHIADAISKAAMSRLASASASSDVTDTEVRHEDGNGSDSAHFQHSEPRS